MKYWQRTRNYRKYVDADGSARHVITVDGVDIEVSAEVYKAYSQADRRERYGYERETGLLLSLERMDEEGTHPARPADRLTESAEETALRQILVEDALGALSCLTHEDRCLIMAVVMDGVSERAYAARIGLTQKAVNKRKHRALKKIRGILVLKPSDFRDE